MQIKKKVTKKQTVDELNDVICNICAKTCANHKREKHDNFGNNEFSGLIEVEVGGGYDSKIIGDMVSWRFSICEHCLKEKVVSQFKIPYDVKDHQLTSGYEPLPAYEKRLKKLERHNQQLFIKNLLKMSDFKKSELKKMTSRELYCLYWSIKMPNYKPTMTIRVKNKSKT